VIRIGTTADAGAMAALHASRISEGFLPTLGTRFLERLYARVVRHPGGFALVEDDDGHVVGFVAGAADIGALYRSFLLRDGVFAAAGAVAPLARSWRRALETLRYPASSTTTDLPEAEILAVAVDAAASGRGIGRALVDASGPQFQARGATSVKVVAGADNVAAVRLYEACGYHVVEEIEVHGGTRSVVLVRNHATAETVA
jgi:ribosomal protein S18 acetylase RimI-like enzyme